ncbi:MAG: hypothetical protein HYU86_01035 [Chloroflexi bacterium]|nr:hypothetical protein [Chloroflexota bacterium]
MNPNPWLQRRSSTWLSLLLPPLLLLTALVGLPPAARAAIASIRADAPRAESEALDRRPVAPG